MRAVPDLVVLATMLLGTELAAAGPAAEHLPAEMMRSEETPSSPVNNTAFVPAADAGRAESLHITVDLRQTEMRLSRQLSQPVCDGRPVELGGSCRGGSDKRLFPGVTLELFSFDDNSRLGSTSVGTMVAETAPRGGRKSYWQVIPQYGRVWKEPADNGWSRAALPLMLVHNFENVAHQGLATFLYRGNDEVTDLRVQFVQQSTPWNTPEHFIAWGRIEMAAGAIDDPDALAIKRSGAKKELAARKKTRPWSELEKQYPSGALDGFGGPLKDRWVVMHAAVRDGVVYYQPSQTPYGPYPYPEDMRFGVRSMTKSITVPLALGRLSQVYGPYVLNLKIGDYVDGLDSGYDEVRFIDAANMATGMGGAGTLVTVPNDGGSGYVDETYDDWYNAAESAAEKVAFTTRDTGPYPWGPGVVHRYRDRDYHLLGMALDGFLKSVRGTEANIWNMLETEVFRPIGIYHAPIVKTIEPDGREGLPWFHAGYYPTVDDIAKVAILYQNHGRFGDAQILNREVTAGIFTPLGGLIKDYDHSFLAAFSGAADEDDMAGREVYKMGFHYTPYETTEGVKSHIPTMAGFSGTGAMLHPNGFVTIRFAKAWPLPENEEGDLDRNDTIRIIQRLP
jgi:hypothetical protein